MDNKTLIETARKRDDTFEVPTILAQLANALEEADAALNFKQGIIEDLSAEVTRLTEENSNLGTELQNWELGGGYL